MSTTNLKLLAERLAATSSSPGTLRDQGRRKGRDCHEVITGHGCWATVPDDLTRTPSALTSGARGDGIDGASPRQTTVGRHGTNVDTGHKAG
jgi:hypothetical protein